VNTRLVVLTLTVAALLVTACGNKSTNGPTGDTTPPAVVFVSPYDGASNVDIETEIQVTFSEAMDLSTLSAANVGQLDGLFDYPSDSQVLIFPVPVLDYGTNYTLLVTTGVTDTAGNALAEVFSWSFTTEPDPATTNPAVVTVTPASGSNTHIAWEPITVLFDKAMDSTSFAPGSISLASGSTPVPGVITYDPLTVTASFQPDDTLDYGTVYTATATTAVADTFGNHLSEAFVWSFTTAADPFIPFVSFDPFYDNAVVDSQVSIAMYIQHPVGVDSIRYYVDGVFVPGATSYEAPWSFDWDASGLDIGQVAVLTARAYAMDRQGESAPMSVIYLWEQMALDDNAEQLPQDVVRMLARTTDTLLELRYEFSADWADAYQDTGVDLGVFFDIDGNPNTGRNEFNGASLNGIGAEYRMILGLHGGDTAMAVWSASRWNKLFDTTGFVYHHIPDSTRVMEVGIDWSDFGNPFGARIVSINAFFHSANEITFDWVPNQGEGYVTILREHRYYGTSPTSAAKQPVPHKSQTDGKPQLPNPFE
jgi:hypothetical protein